MEPVERYRVRYDECDMQGVVFNANYWVWVDDAVAQWMRRGVGAHRGVDATTIAWSDLGFDFMVKTASGTWHEGATHGDIVDAACEVSRWGNTSFDVRVSLTVEARPIFDCTIVYVSVEPGTHTPCRVPDSIRDALTVSA